MKKMLIHFDRTLQSTYAFNTCTQLNYLNIKLFTHQDNFKLNIPKFSQNTEAKWKSLYFRVEI